MTRILILIAVAIASLVLNGCEKEQKKITAEPRQENDSRKTGSSVGASPEGPKRPALDQPRDRHDRENPPKSQQAQQSAKTDAEKAGRSTNKSTAESRKQAESVTPLDQSGRDADLAITQRIRQALVREDLSFAAKNVLVITEPDHVVLKGQVRSSSEAERIKGIAGTITTRRIEDALEITR